MIPTALFFLKIALAIQSLYGFRYILGLFYFYEKCNWNFVRDCIESVYYLE